jgi:CRISPR-associated protein Csm1
MPVTRAAHEAEERLAKAKNDGRDRVHVVLAPDTRALTWDQYAAALSDAEQLHEFMNSGSDGMTTALLYKLLWLDGRRRDCEERRKINAADWRSKLGYLLWRTLPKGRAIDEERRAFLCKLMGVGPELDPLVTRAEQGHGVLARVALSIAIYRNR